MTRQGRGVVIDEARCSGCGLCVIACPAGCLELSDDFNDLGYHPVRYSGDGCRDDGLCLSACPRDGILFIEAHP